MWKGYANILSAMAGKMKSYLHSVRALLYPRVCAPQGNSIGASELSPVRGSPLKSTNWPGGEGLIAANVFGQARGLELLCRMIASRSSAIQIMLTKGSMGRRRGDRNGDARLRYSPRYNYWRLPDLALSVEQELYRLLLRS